MIIKAAGESFIIPVSPASQVWDTRQRAPVNTFQSTYQVTAVSFNDTAEQIFSGGIDNELKVGVDS